MLVRRSYQSKKGDALGPTGPGHPNNGAAWTGTYTGPVAAASCDELQGVK